jgi:hypothetical protein
MLRRRRKLTPEQIAAQGGNKSFIHIDWMIGSDKVDIDGVHADGAACRSSARANGPDRHHRPLAEPDARQHHGEPEKLCPGFGRAPATQAGWRPAG